MQIQELNFVTVALSEEEHAKLEAASDILNQITSALFPCRNDDQIGNQNTLENFATHKELTDMADLFDWLCDMTAEGSPIGNYKVRTN